jgi:hypothetical protein
LFSGVILVSARIGIIFVMGLNAALRWQPVFLRPYSVPAFHDNGGTSTNGEHRRIRSG